MVNQHAYDDDFKIRVVKDHLSSTPTNISHTALKYGLYRGTVKTWVDTYRHQIENPIQDKVKILFWDVETSWMILEYASYDLKISKKYHHIEEIKNDWFMFGAAWMFLDDKHPQCISVSPNDVKNDYEVVATLHSVLSQADILVGHNSDQFDYKKFNARAIYYNMPPISPKATIDTLKVARQNFKFSSNKLAYIARYLGLDAKDDSPDWGLCYEGDTQELGYMRQYNKKDVIVTRDVYLKLRPYMKNHPNLNVYNNIKDISGVKLDLCPNCGQHSLNETPYFKYTRSGKYKVFHCKSCGAYSQDKKNCVNVKIK